MTMTDAEINKREKIVKGMKKNMQSFKDRYGDRAKEVIYATATKKALGEQAICSDCGTAPCVCDDSHGLVSESHYFYGKGSHDRFMEKAKEVHGEITKGKTNAHGQTAYHDKSGKQIGMHDIDGEGDHTYNVFKKSVKESLDLDEGTFVYHMNKAIDAHDRGDDKKKQMHLDNAKTARYSLKSTDIVKHKDLLNKYSQMREEFELGEAIDKDHPIVKEYNSLKKNHDIKSLRGLIKGQHRIVDTSEYKTKDHAISAYLRTKHGDKKVDHAFGFNKEDVNLEAKISTAQMSHQGKATIKHIDNPGVELRMAAHDIKPGIKGFKDRYDLLNAAKAQGKLKEDAEDIQEVSAVQYPGSHDKDTAIMVHPETKQRVTIQRKHIDNYPSHKGWKEVGAGQKTNEEVVTEGTNHREFAQQGKMHPDMAKWMTKGHETDYYHPKTGDKVSGIVKDRTTHSVTMQANKNGRIGGGETHKFAVSKHLSEQLTKEQFENGEFETTMKSYKDFMIGLDEALWPGTPEYKKKFGDGQAELDRAKGSTSASTHGTTTGTGTGVKHTRDYEKAEKETAKPETTEKRGRGRPAGSTSGARQKGAIAKTEYAGAEYTGHKLHLPNNNR